MVNLRIVLSQQISHQFSKKARVHQKITIDQLVFSVFSKIFERLEHKYKSGYFYGSWEAILSGIPQGFIFGPLLFNIFMCNMFLILKGTCFTGYADDNTPFVVRDNVTDVKKALE